MIKAFFLCLPLPKFISSFFITPLIVIELPFLFHIVLLLLDYELILRL